MREMVTRGHRTITGRALPRIYPMENDASIYQRKMATGISEVIGLHNRG